MLIPCAPMQKCFWKLEQSPQSSNVNHVQVDRGQQRHKIGWADVSSWRADLARKRLVSHYSNVIMGAMAYRITSPTIVYSTVYSGANKRKHESSASLAFVRGIPWWPVNSLHKGPVTRKMFPFDDVIMPPQETLDLVVARLSSCSTY